MILYYLKNLKISKNRVVFKIINYDSNKKFLRDIPFKRFLDLAIVYYVVFDEFMGKKATITINNTYIKKSGVSQMKNWRSRH